MCTAKEANAFTIKYHLTNPEFLQILKDIEEASKNGKFSMIYSDRDEEKINNIGRALVNLGYEVEGKYNGYTYNYDLTIDWSKGNELLV